jgi:hypothetical protein
MDRSSEAPSMMKLKSLRDVVENLIETGGLSEDAVDVVSDERIALDGGVNTCDFDVEVVEDAWVSLDFAGLSYEVSKSEFDEKTFTECAEVLLRSILAGTFCTMRYKFGPLAFGRVPFVNGSRYEGPLRLPTNDAGPWRRFLVLGQEWSPYPVGGGGLSK